MVHRPFNLDNLYKIIADRRNASVETSYTARLYAGGRASIVRKFGEEAVELSVAALAEESERATL